MTLSARLLWAAVAGGVLGFPAPASAADDDEAVLEFHFRPVKELQIAIWLETPKGEHVRDVFVTQATGKLGIANRPGVWNFPSAWRWPYGPRRNVLPVWGHRRGKTYPEIVFHDDDPEHQTSLGWHEPFSSAEPYFCTPLTIEQHEALIQMDTMSCPSPTAFHTDKGRFAPDGKRVSVYPPRTDVTAFEPERDHVDIMAYSELNDLDEVTGATPPGDVPTVRAITLRRDEVPEGPLVALIEVSLERDENEVWQFDREDDHFIDPLLLSWGDFGVEWLGQPAIVFRVELDPGVEGFFGTADFHGYGDLDGASGTIHPPDGTIAASGGSGADRLRLFDAFGQDIRFGVHSTGWRSPDASCAPTELPPLADLSVTPTGFDRLGVEFTLPDASTPGAEIVQLSVYVQPSREPLPDEALRMGEQRDFRVCSESAPGCAIVAAGGERVTVEVDRLFGDYTYQLGVGYRDRCTRESDLASGSATTPSQEFQQIETACFVATAAFGTWAPEVAALRALRDQALVHVALGRELVGLYRAYGPALARLIAHRPLLRAGTRALLQPLAAGAGRALRTRVVR